MLELPEEILDQIVCLSLSPSHPDDLAFPSLECLIRPTRSSYILNILLTSRKFLRIATQHVYNTICLTTHSQAQLLLSSMENNPLLAPHVQSLTILGVWPEAGRIMRLCKGAVRRFEITLELFDEYGPPVDREYGDGLRELVGVRHLIVRKPYHVYLSLPKLRYIMIALANAIKGWIELVRCLLYTYSSLTSLHMLSTTGNCKHRVQALRRHTHIPRPIIHPRLFLIFTSIHSSFLPHPHHHHSQPPTPAQPNRPNDPTR
jgi:hypothetical protein